MKKALLILAFIPLLVNHLIAEPVKSVKFNSVRLLKEGMQKDIYGKGSHVVKDFPARISELHFYNGAKRILLNRESLSNARMDHPLFDPLFDCKLKTEAPWKELTHSACIHAAFKDYGFRVNYAYPLQATSMIIASPDVNSLKGFYVTLFNGDNITCDIDLFKTLSKAGESGVFKVGLTTKEATKLKALPKELKPYVPLNPRDYIKGEFLDFKTADDLKKCKVITHWNSQGELKVKNEMLSVEPKPKAKKNRRLYTGKMILPWNLTPGKTLAVEVDSKFDMWLNKTELEVKLGQSSFKLENSCDLFVPDGSQYIAATSKGMGYIAYTLFLTRGKDKEEGDISWKIIGQGYNREGKASLLQADASQKELPITVGLLRQWSWVWFNLPSDKWDGPYLNELRLDSIGIGELSKPLPKLAEAHKYSKPNFSTPNYKKWNQKVSKMNLPAFAPHPDKNKGPVSKEELEIIKPWLKALPLPQSNKGVNHAWCQEGIAKRIYRLLNETDDFELLDILLLWSESLLEWRNGGKHYSVSYWSESAPEGEVLQGAWPAGPGKMYIDGKLHGIGEAWDFSAWVVFMEFAEYVARHPELYNKKVPVGKDAGKMTYLEKAKSLIDEAFVTIKDIQKRYVVDGKYGIDRPWNRYTSTIAAFHRLRTTLDYLEKNGVKVDPERKVIAKGFVETFLKNFYDPAHYEIFKVEHEGKPIEVLTFRYSKSPLAPAEDKQHGSAELSVLSELYKSGLYKDIMKPEYMRALRDTVKYRLYKGKDPKSGKEIFAATFGREPAMKHAGCRPGLPYSYLFLFEDDPEYYEKFARMYRKKNLKSWEDYLGAIFMRLDREKVAKKNNK